MRRRTVKALANVVRLGGLVACAGAAATLWVWHTQPRLVASLEKWMEEKLTAKVRNRWKVAQDERDPVLQADLLEKVLARVPHVQRQDRFADVVSDCNVRLSHLAEERGDLAAATRWMRDAVAFDDHTLETQARLGGLLCRQPETAQEGLAQLGALAKKFPANAYVVPVLASSLARLGRARDALAVLEAAAATQQSNLWLVFWDTGGDLRVNYAQMIPAVNESVLRMRFDVVDRTQRLRFMLPRFASCALVNPKLHVGVADQRAVIDLLGPAVKMHQMRRSSGALEAIGYYDCYFDVALPELPAGNLEVTLDATLQPLRSSRLALPVLETPLTAYRDELRRTAAPELTVLDDWRRAALAGLHMYVYHHGPGQGFEGKRRVQAAVEPAADGTFSVHWPIGQGATRLRIDLPDGLPDAIYRLTAIDVRIDGRTEVLDPVQMKLLGTTGLERRDGVFHARTDDPFFQFAAPDGERIESVTLRGEL